MLQSLVSVREGCCLFETRMLHCVALVYRGGPPLRRMLKCVLLSMVPRAGSWVAIFAPVRMRTTDVLFLCYFRIAPSPKSFSLPSVHQDWIRSSHCTPESHELFVATKYLGLDIRQYGSVLSLLVMHVL